MCWNCGDLSTTTCRLCEEVQFDVLGLTETHLDTPLSSRSFLTASAASADDCCLGELCACSLECSSP